jgi:OOP family OmpA-OmpF porin
MCATRQNARRLCTDNVVPMRITFAKRKTLLVAGALALGVFSAAASAQIEVSGKTPVGPHLVYEKVVFDANVLFDSSRSALRRAGRDALDAFVGEIHGLESRSVIAIGYADRMGSEGDNQILSEERVNTVKAYLVSKGVAADRVKTSAWGATRPSTSVNQCRDANNPKNVACMQVDRHVFVEISGTRIAR